MKVFYNLEELPLFDNAVVTIGSFDGVHGGHQEIFDQICQLAQNINGKSVVITFNPHPRHVLAPHDNEPKLLTTIAEKIALIENYGVDYVVVAPFSVAFSQLTPQQYLEDFLIRYFKPAYIVIGYDHRFGANREGDISFLKQNIGLYNYKIIEIEAQTIKNLAISSTKIRKYLEDKDIASANQLLDYRYQLTGKVVQGQKIGRTIGFPTANLSIDDKYKLIPPQGIYAVFAYHKGIRYGAMLYIGNRPTLEKYHNTTIEVNIFNFDKDIYGDDLTIEFVDFIRNDQKFGGLEALKAQLAQDKIDAEAILSKLDAGNSSVAVVILNYNGKKYLEQFLPSVLKTTYPNTQIYVADNGSKDDSVVFLKENYASKVHVILLEKNYGFAEGYNRAMQQVNANYYVLLNSDVEVTSNWLQPLVKLLESDKQIAVCQPKILSYQQRGQFEHAGASGGFMDFLGYPFCRGRIFYTTEPDHGQYDTSIEIFWATGAAFFIRHNLFNEFGGFDASFFAHMEEIDLCWRLKRAGYKIMVAPTSQVYHVGGGTLDYLHPKKTYMNFRNSLATLFKNEPCAKLIWLIPLRLILDGLAGAMYLWKGEFKNIMAIIMAHFHFYARLPKLLKKRREINELIEKKSIGVFNKKGLYEKSIVWAYFWNKKRKYSD